MERSWALAAGATATLAAAYFLRRRRQAAYQRRLPRLTFLDLRLAVVRLPASATMAEANFSPDVKQHKSAKFFSLTRTEAETSIVVDEQLAPEPSPGVQVETGWVIFRLEGPLDFALIGILSRIAVTLAAKKISIFAMSTYDTDYVLLKHESRGAAINALRQAGYQFSFATCK